MGILLWVEKFKLGLNELFVIIKRVLWHSQQILRRHSIGESDKISNLPSKDFSPVDFIM